MVGRSLIVAAALATLGCGGITPLAGTPDATPDPPAPLDAAAATDAGPTGRGPKDINGTGSSGGNRSDDNGAGNDDGKGSQRENSVHRG